MGFVFFADYVHEDERQCWIENFLTLIDILWTEVGLGESK